MSWGTAFASSCCGVVFFVFVGYGLLGCGLLLDERRDHSSFLVSGSALELGGYFVLVRCDILFIVDYSLLFTERRGLLSVVG